jgi:hypothetical protein
VNYTIITSLFFFLCLLYLAPAVRGNCRQGIYTVFLVLSIPLFVYQSTTTYADVRLAMPFALGLLFFTFYVRDGEDRDLKTMLIFFTIACFVKKNGEIAGLTGLFVAAAYTFYSFLRERKLPDIRASLYLLPLLAYFAVKQAYSNSVGSMFNLVASAANKAVDTVTLSSEISAADEYKLRGFFESLFLSGNFGILFYVLIAAVVFNYRKVFSKHLVWEFAFITIVFLEIFYYMVFYFSELEMHSAIVHRTVIILSVVSSVFLASLWAGPDEEKNRGG